jgi:hypothetical protein
VGQAFQLTLLPPYTLVMDPTYAVAAVIQKCYSSCIYAKTALTYRREELFFTLFFKALQILSTILMDVPCILYSLLSRPTNAQYIQYFIYRKHSYMIQCICTIYRESYPSTLLKLQKSLRLQT